MSEQLELCYTFDKLAFIGETTQERIEAFRAARRIGDEKLIAYAGQAMMDSLILAEERRVRVRGCGGSVAFNYNGAPHRISVPVGSIMEPPVMHEATGTLEGVYGNLQRPATLGIRVRDETSGAFGESRNRTYTLGVQLISEFEILEPDNHEK